jgi:cob(I)alamin adenosyltransferase
MKIYTRTGDAGETGLFGGGRVRKDHPRVAAYGAVDELNSVLGWALTELAAGPTAERLGRIQHDLFSLGAELATPPARERRRRPDTPPIPEARIADMERWMDEMDAGLPPLDRFVLPGGTRAAAALHVARTVCRRAEREVVALAEQDEVAENVIRYLNRLSDLLFVCARHENALAGGADVVWEPDAAL